MSDLNFVHQVKHLSDISGWQDRIKTLQSENAKLKKDLETATLALKAIASMPDTNDHNPFDMPAALSEALSDTLARAEKTESENASLQRLVNGIKEEAQMYKQCYSKSLEHLGLSGDDICPNAEEFICLLKKINDENLILKEMLERMAEALKEISNDTECACEGGGPFEGGHFMDCLYPYHDKAELALAEYQKWKEGK